MSGPRKTISTSMSLPQLVATIKACIVKANQAGDKYEQFSIATGKHLADAKLRLQAKNKSIRSQKKADRTEQPQTWKDFCAENFDFSQQRADLFIAVSNGDKSIEKLRSETAERMRISRQRKKSPSRDGRKSEQDKAPTVQPRISSSKERGTYAAIRDHAHEIGCKLCRHGKQYDLTMDGETHRCPNLDAVVFMLDNYEGKFLTIVKDDCENNPLSIRVEANPEEAKAYAAARADNDKKKFANAIGWLKDLTAQPAKMFADLASDEDVTKVVDFLNYVKKTSHRQRC